MGSSIEKLTELFSRFPGIGPRQARRFVYYLLSQNGSFANEIATELLKLKQEIAGCTSCQRFFKGKAGPCSICNNISRDQSMLLVVEKDTDLDSLERSGVYKGLYYVLGGIIPILDKAPEDRVRLRELKTLVKQKTKSGVLKEIILALSATPDGDHTGDFVRDELKPLVADIPIHVFGRGLSTGTELEYADQETLRSAFAGRT